VHTGRDCWAREEMADGFSANARMSGVSARFLGREPDWRERLDAAGLECDDPPEQSLLDPR
jgi:hypothetical protein